LSDFRPKTLLSLLFSVQSGQFRTILAGLASGKNRTFQDIFDRNHRFSQIFGKNGRFRPVSLISAKTGILGYFWQNRPVLSRLLYISSRSLRFICCVALKSFSSCDFIQLPMFCSSRGSFNPFLSVGYSALSVSFQCSFGVGGGGFCSRD